MNANLQLFRLGPQREELQVELGNVHSAIAKLQEEIETLEEVRRLQPLLQSVKRDMYDIEREPGFTASQAHIAPGSPPTPTRSNLRPPADGSPRRASAPTFSTQNHSIQTTYDFAFADKPPAWARPSPTPNQRTPIAKRDQITTGSNPIMICKELGCIVLLGTVCNLIWSPICGANCSDGQRFSTGMAGLRGHITQLHPGYRTEGYDKFIMSNDGTQSLSKDNMTDIRVRLVEPELRLGIRTGSNTQQADPEADAEADPNEMEIDGEPTDEEVEEREVEDEEVEETERAPDTQIDDSNRPFRRFTNRALAASQDFRRHASRLDDSDEEPISAKGKRTRRGRTTNSDGDFFRTPAECAKTGRTSLPPGTYTLPSEGQHEWEDKDKEKDNDDDGII